MELDIVATCYEPDPLDLLKNITGELTRRASLNFLVWYTCRSWMDNVSTCTEVGK